MHLQHNLLKSVLGFAIFALATSFSLTSSAAFSSFAKLSSHDPGSWNVRSSKRHGLINLQASGKPTVVVAGATGRVGRLVVQELLKVNKSGSNTEISVKALVRDEAKAQSVLPPPSSSLEILKCDLANESELKKACTAASAVIWCATGFADSSSIIDRFTALFRLKFTPKQAIDIAALAAIGLVMKESTGSQLGGPRVVMCSSAGVTRLTWSEEKKKRYEGVADIPIVRLNPFGILDVKREGETVLRQSGASYCVVRPCGLNDKWPTGRAVLTQGDMAVGRMNRQDVASLLVSMIFEPAAAGKTFESIGLPGYPAPASYALQLSRLRKDSEIGAGEGDITPESDAVYALMQQLVPGEAMQPNALAMGQTYEQLDRGEKGLLGPRGAELPPIVRSG